MFAPRLVTRIEEQLHGGGNSDFLYEGLKAYLMLADSEHYDPDFIKAWIALDWDRNLPRDLPADQRQAFAHHRFVEAAGGGQALGVAPRQQVQRLRAHGQRRLGGQDALRPEPGGVGQTSQQRTHPGAPALSGAGSAGAAGHNGRAGPRRAAQARM